MVQLTKKSLKKNPIYLGILFHAHPFKAISTFIIQGYAHLQYTTTFRLKIPLLSSAEHKVSCMIARKHHIFVLSCASASLPAVKVTLRSQGGRAGMMELHAYQVWQSGSIRADHRLCVSAPFRIMHHPCDTKGQRGFTTAVNSSSGSIVQNPTVEVYMGGRYQFLWKFRKQKKKPQR